MFVLTVDCLESNGVCMYMCLCVCVCVCNDVLIYCKCFIENKCEKLVRKGESSIKCVWPHYSL